MFRFLLFVLLLWPSYGRAADFDIWLQDFRREAAASGISHLTLIQALDNITPDPGIVKQDRTQPEVKKTFKDYYNRRATPEMLKKGQRLFQKHRTLLKKIEQDYGVPGRYIVAIWGLETAYGGYTGNKDVIRSLVTLAWDHRRAAYFRKELLAALKILDRGDMRLDQMRGSWAGALGQCQFMPSNYLKLAVDYDGDGKKDIHNSLPDVFASIARYLQNAGWRAGERWGRPVKLPQNINRKHLSLKVKKPIAYWQKQGIRHANGRDLPASDMKASIVVHDNGPVYMVYKNYRTFMAYNPATLYASTVALAGDQIGKAGQY